jgi:thiol-disulfide isomerase/thioredoxin
MKAALVTRTLVGILAVCQIPTLAQDMPQAGRPVPQFRIDRVTHFSTSSVTEANFKGKWLFIDFWSPGCITCIQSLPKVNAIQKQFKDNVVWIMVGLNNQRHKGIEALYERLQEKQGLTMPAAYDSALAERWGVRSLPHIVIVGPDGIVRAVTDGRDLTKEKVGQLIEGKPVKFYPKRTEKRPEFFSPLSVQSLDVATTYSSLLTGWNGEDQRGGIETERWLTWPEDEQDKGYIFAMVPVYALYNYAYFGRWDWNHDDTLFHGKIYPQPILEIRDKSIFEFDYNFNVGKGLYNYCLNLPAAERNTEFIMACMQEDLKRAFKYEACIELREMPVWKLVGGRETVERLKTKGGEPYMTPGSHAAGYSMRNMGVKHLIGGLSSYASDNQPPFIDGTGLKGNIDFTIDADMTSIPDMRRALKLQGLDLVEERMMFSVLVIREP